MGQKVFFPEGSNPVTRAELALIADLAANGKGQTQEDAKNGNLKIETYTSTFRFKVPNNQAGKVVLFDPSYGFAEGEIPEEWDRGQLAAGVNIAVSHIRTGFVADAAATRPANAVAYANLVNGWVAALRNGRYAFSQSNGNPVYVHVDKTGPQAASFQSSTEDDGIEFHSPIIFREQKTTRFELFIPAGQSFGAPAGGNYLELSMFGVWVRPRA